LSVFSRRGMFKRQVSDACNRCMKCHRECPMAAIPKEPEKTAAAECIQCLHCSQICPQSAISFKPALFSSPAGFNTAPDLSRRGLFLSLGAGALAAASLKTSPFIKLSGPRLIRPPGAMPENLFSAQCIRCGECMKVCLTNTLQPCLWESGLDGLWSPRLVPRLAGCDQTCSLCGQVCPTGAIRALALEEKKNAKLGTAVIDRERCLVWAEDKLCLICDEQCPYNAIIFKWQDGVRRPFVKANKCNGCGFCEEKCPVRGESAIVVNPEGEIRLAEGSYQEAAKKLQLEFKEDPGTDKFLFEGDKGSASDGEKAQAGAEAGAEKLPQGFSVK
jgi:ferredoxin